MNTARFKPVRVGVAWRVIVVPGYQWDSMTVDGNMTEEHAAILCDALNSAVRTCSETYDRPEAA